MNGRPGDYLTPYQVAAMIGVDSKTVTRWAKKGRLPYHRTLGGHHRFKRADVEQLRESLQNPPGNQS